MTQSQPSRHSLLVRVSFLKCNNAFYFLVILRPLKETDRENIRNYNEIKNRTENSTSRGKQLHRIWCMISPGQTQKDITIFKVKADTFHFTPSWRFWMLWFGSVFFCLQCEQSRFSTEAEGIELLTRGRPAARLLSCPVQGWTWCHIKTVESTVYGLYCPKQPPSNDYCRKRNT